MKTSDFFFHLPPELIAQTPLSQRDSSRLLRLDKKTGAISHETFHDLPSFLQEGDCLILNNSRVLPARLLGQRAQGGKGELLLLNQKDNAEDTIWECLVQPGKKLRQGATISFGNGELTAEIIEVLDNGNRLVKFNYQGIFLEVLETLGKMPLPPYIKEELGEKERYQTVYAKETGSAAAPTAGLHFTPELLEGLKAKGINIGFVTLHVGLGTFRPVQVEDVNSHQMHSELAILPPETAKLIQETKQSGGKVYAVGTTSCRTLESFAHSTEIVTPQSKWTDIFIYPGYQFQVVDGLITNFHLPESTLIMLVSALARKESILKAYETAVQEKYRFFSFGDAMLIQ
ncbi:MAG: tRNA preQ1(34) S-adenosylmethionine ribosyltransferase-isomerase QueA [Eubacteriales bacterium]